MSDAPIRIVLVEDHTVFRQAMAMALDREPDLRVVGGAGTLAEARELLRSVSADVAVVDIDLPDGSGIDLIREVIKPGSLAEVLVLTASATRIDIARAVEVGASGVLHKTTPLPQIVDAVRRLCAGQPVMEPAEMVALLRLVNEHRMSQQRAEAALARLTRREREVLTLLGEGLGDKDMAERLHVGKETVHTHMVNILGKLGVETRLQALIFAIRHGLVHLE
jgi:DNA-binding NarL/FixJ family response regulator